MADPLANALLAAQVVAVGLFAWVPYHKGWLTASAAGVAFVLGAAIVLSTSVLWLLVLVSLLLFSSLATRFRYADKVARGTAEAKGGARRVRNVLSNGLAPTAVAVLTPFILLLDGGVDWAHVAALTFLSAVAAAGADTMASELGSLSDRVYLITSWRRVPPGTDGGISLPGQMAALLGAGIIAGLGLLLLGLVAPEVGLPPAMRLGWVGPAVIVLAGFFGCQVDSLAGATLELRGYVNKEEVNLLGITAGAALGFALGVVLG